MACFFVPSGYQPLKEKLKVLVTADTVLAWIPFFAMILWFILNLVFPNQLGPALNGEDYFVVGFVCMGLCALQLVLVWGISSILKKHSADAVDIYGYCLFKIFLQYLWINWISNIALRQNGSEASWPLSTYFLVGLIIFYATLTPYQIYELILVIYFHFLSKKIRNPADVVNFVSIVEVGVEIGVPPRGDGVLKV